MSSICKWVSIRTLHIWVWWIRVSTHKITLKDMISFKRCKLGKKSKFHYVFSCYIYALSFVFKNEKLCSIHLGFFVFHAWELKGFFCFHFCNLLASNVGDHTILNGDLYLQPLSLLIYFWVVWSFAIIVL